MKAGNEPPRTDSRLEFSLLPSHVGLPPRHHFQVNHLRKFVVFRDLRSSLLEQRSKACWDELRQNSVRAILAICCGKSQIATAAAFVGCIELFLGHFRLEKLFCVLDALGGTLCPQARAKVDNAISVERCGGTHGGLSYSRLLFCSAHSEFMRLCVPSKGRITTGGRIFLPFILL